MARGARVALARCPHHIVQRGHNRRVVFVTDGDRQSYLETLAEFRSELALKVYAYCLMTNHVHLIVDPGDDADNLSLLMKRLAGRHTRRVNRLERRTGTSWEGRFKCSPIETDRYLLACSRYVDLNPVRAGMVKRPDEYRWSSYRSRAGIERNDWLDDDECLKRLAPSLEQCREQYRDYVSQGVTEYELQLIRGAIQRNQLTGSESFMVEVEQRIGRRILQRSRGRPNRSRDD
jgi:putative transposase